MGRNKITIERLKKYTDKRATYGKRHMGLLKKAYELSVLCDVPMALLVFPPPKSTETNGAVVTNPPRKISKSTETNGAVTDPRRKIKIFSRLMRFEDILINCLKYEAPAHEDQKNADPEPRIEIPDIEDLIQQLEFIKLQDDSYIPPTKEPGNQEGNSSPRIASEQGRQSPTDLQRDEMKRRLYSTDKIFDFFGIILWLYRSHQDAPTDDTFLLDYCENKLNNILLEIQQEKQQLAVDEQKTRLLNALKVQDIVPPPQQQQQQLQLQQNFVHKDQASVEPFDNIRKMENVTEKNPSYSTHMPQSQMAPQYQNYHVQVPVQAPSQYQDTQQNQGLGITKNYDVSLNFYNAMGYGDDANYFCYNGPYPEYDNTNSQGSHF